MSTLLHIDSSPFAAPQSFSRQLTGEFVEAWRAAHPGGDVIRRDLTATPLPIIDAEWVIASRTPAANQTPEQAELVTLSNTLIHELRSADEYVIGIAMHNFMVPTVFKAWIDQIARFGETFTYENGVPTGLLTGKRATVVLTSGGVYEPGSPREAYNFIEPYLKAVFRFIGIADVVFIYAGGTAQVMYGADPEAILTPPRQAVASRVGAVAAA